ncbi:hypothetical protein PG996_015439 [Apiospora saccharicola]|uniref:Uncharacterized protein n=1 Tax=Apiospora saccharicola TaxID=335842 RepID=A0ABR1TN81_9PEZI
MVQTPTEEVGERSEECASEYFWETGSMTRTKNILPILKGVERFSTFINLVDGSNTVFASGGGELFKLTQSSAAGAKIHIPVISDILEMIGIPSISFLDMFLWIGAVSCDVFYDLRGSLIYLYAKEI